MKVLFSESKQLGTLNYYFLLLHKRLWPFRCEGLKCPGLQTWCNYFPSPGHTRRDHSRRPRRAAPRVSQPRDWTRLASLSRAGLRGSRGPPPTSRGDSDRCLWNGLPPPWGSGHPAGGRHCPVLCKGVKVHRRPGRYSTRIETALHIKGRRT